MTVELKGLIETSLIDWPGRLATVLFLPGCNLRCRYCHARDLVLNPAAVEGISGARAFAFLETMAGWVDGVVISGGEPTLHPALADLASEARSRGLAVKLDTNGTRPGVLESLFERGLLDAVSMDVKAPLDSRYEDIAQTPVDLDAVRRSIGLIRASGLEHEFRTTVAPALLSPADVGRIAEAVEGAALYTLQPFNPHVCLDRLMEEQPPCPPSYLHDAARLAEGFVKKVVVRAR